MASFYNSPELDNLFKNLSTKQHSQLIQRSLAVIAKLAEEGLDRLDWKILAAALEDLEQGFQVFSQYRHTRKIAIFGSARIARNTPEYKQAVVFARQITEAGFMVITGAGGGIMAAGNEGATREKSFGLNIRLPFEQTTNEFIAGDKKLISFKYFFTRKLFFLRESDAIALFPGGFGTQDEAFETLTLCQTGKYGPVPLVLIDKPGGDYWYNWNQYICKYLVARGLVDEYDVNLYTITDDLEVACQTIRKFYSVYHSSRYVNAKLVIRLNCELSEAEIEQLNQEFADILLTGKIVATTALPQEQEDETVNLPRLLLHFDTRKYGRLYQMINQINELGADKLEAGHPERK